MVMRVLILTGGTVEENFAKDYISKWIRLLQLIKDCFMLRD